MPSLESLSALRKSNDSGVFISFSLIDDTNALSFTTLSANFLLLTKLAAISVDFQILFGYNKFRIKISRNLRI